MEWLFLNARGKHTEASSVLSKLVVSGDASGDAAKLLAPSADPKGLPLRAALLRKATVLLRMRKNAAADDAAAAAATEALAHNTGPIFLTAVFSMSKASVSLGWRCLSASQSV